MGSLQESLNKFKQQQERCQSTLTSIAAKSGSSKVTVSSLAKARPPAPAAKFSDDTTRLQLKNSIRNSRPGTQIKRVIDLLHKTRQSLTAEQIDEACYVDIKSNKAVFDSLRDNPKVQYDGVRFRYKPNYELKDKDELQKLIKGFPEGISVIDLTDAYPTVMKDLKALKAAGQIWLLSNVDSKEDVAYPNDTRVTIDLDDNLKQLFHETELPSQMTEIEKYLQKNGMKPATNTAKRVTDYVPKTTSNPKPKKKKQEINKRTKLTNAHLPELFQNLLASK